MFITNAYAQEAVAAGEPSILMGYMPLILIVLIMYFLFLRPQNKRIREHQEMILNLRRGDKIITSGGLYAEITKVNDENFVQAEIADGVQVKLERQSIATMVMKDTISNDKPAKKSKKAKKPKKTS